MTDIFSLIRELRDILNDLDKTGAEVRFENDHGLNEIKQKLNEMIREITKS